MSDEFRGTAGPTARDWAQASGKERRRSVCGWRSFPRGWHDGIEYVLAITMLRRTFRP